MITVDEALERIGAAIEPLATEEVEFSRALGRRLAETIVADRDFPPTDRSAMDGFAVRAADLPAGQGTLRLVGEQRAGAPARREALEAGETVRITTGAIVPDGADAVVMVERTEVDEGGGVRFVVEGGVGVGDHIRHRASDLAAGESVLEVGQRLRAAEIAALASVGKTRVAVRRAPTVRILTTGDEIVAPDREPEPHQVRNSNAFALAAQLEALGVASEICGVAPDEAEGLEAAMAAALEGADLLLLSGGVSVGPYDLVGQSLRRHGLELAFHGVAVKPGKPVLFGRCGATAVFGLPGNPVSTFACFQLFVEPALRRMAGDPAWLPRYVEATLTAPIRCRPGRRIFHLARLEQDGAGRWSGERIAATGSGDVLAMSRANGFLVTEASSAGAEPGERLAALLWRD